ncbi:FAD:protein FMN transferase [Thermodesulfobacteriota bacterium]
MVSQVRPLLHTFVEIKLWGPKAEEAIDAAFIEMGRLNDLLNNYDLKSEVSEINRKAGKVAVVISPETMDALRKAKSFCELSGGALDFTIGPLVKLWGFAKDKPGLPGREPDDAKIKSTRALVDYRLLELINKTKDGQAQRSAFLNKEGMSIDVGSFGKGYIVDRAMDILKEHGIENALIAAGGTICTMGRKPDNSLWTTAIRHPRNNKSFLTVLTFNNKSVSTSGDYEKFYKKKGKRRTHIIDPRTGIPVESIQSATVIAPDGMTSDSLSTALFVLGPEEGMKLVNSLPEVEALIVSQGGDIVFSKGWPVKEIAY